MEEEAEKKVSKNKIIFIAIGLAAAAAVVVILIKQYQVSQVAGDLPDYLVPNSLGVSTYTPTDTAGYALVKKQSLGEGITYTVDKMQKEAVTEVYNKMKEDGWIAVGGSNQDNGATTLKMGRKREAIFIIFEGGQAEGEKTTVKVVPVEVAQ